MMWGYGFGWGWLMMSLGTILWIAVLVVLVWALIRWLTTRTSTLVPPPSSGAQSGPTALEILRQRYARGEIDTATFEQMRERLEATPGYRPDNQPMTSGRQMPVRLIINEAIQGRLPERQASTEEVRIVSWPLLIIQLLQYRVVAESLVRKRDGKGDNVIVTYHDSSQAINCLGLHPEARHITQGTLGLELREMPQSDVCCGFGSSTSIEHGDVAERIMNNKLNNAASTEAMVLVADNPGCLMHLRGGVDASGRKMRALHLVLVCGAKWPLERLHSKQEVLFW